jgi:hypothetical protein
MGLVLFRLRWSDDDDDGDFGANLGGRGGDVVENKGTVHQAQPHLTPAPQSRPHIVSFHFTKQAY